MWWGMTSLRKGNIHKPSFQPRSLPVENWAMRLPEVMIGYFGVAYPGSGLTVGPGAIHLHLDLLKHIENVPLRAH